LDVDTPTETKVTWSEQRFFTAARLEELRETYFSDTGTVSYQSASEGGQVEVILNQFRRNAYVMFRCTRKIPLNGKDCDIETVTGSLDPQTGFADGYWKREYAPYATEQEADKLIAEAIYSNGVPILGSLQFGNGSSDDGFYHGSQFNALSDEQAQPDENYFLPSLGSQGKIVRIKLDPILDATEKSKLTGALAIRGVKDTLPTIAEEDQKARTVTATKNEIWFRKFMLSPLNPIYWCFRALLPNREALVEIVERTSAGRIQEDHLKLRLEGRDTLKMDRLLSSIDHHLIKDPETLSPYAQAILTLIRGRKKQGFTLVFSNPDQTPLSGPSGMYFISAKIACGLIAHIRVLVRIRNFYENRLKKPRQHLTTSVRACAQPLRKFRRSRVMRREIIGCRNPASLGVRG
jgi:hypothetical protein